MSEKENRKKTNKRAAWTAIGAIILILLLLLWFTIVDADGDPNNGFIAPLMGMLR
ncbi:MAG: hypothetical protein HDS75_03810 [Bacteroidales bacterium]|nr:hypothetical protein [Bacteroidales bacterium]